MTAIVVTGGAGQVGRALVRRAFDRAVDLRSSTVDVTDLPRLRAELTALAPGVIIHAAAKTDVDGCESDPTGAWQVNVAGTHHAATVAREVGAHLIYVSTNFVFDGAASQACTERDRPRPINVYGESKLGGELVAGPTATIIRSGWICGDGPNNLVAAILRQLDAGAPLRFIDDVWGQPTDADELADALLDLAAERPPGVVHVAGTDPMTPFALAELVADAAGVGTDLIERAALDDPVRARPARRPVNGVLDLNWWVSTGHAPLAPFATTLPQLIGRIRAGG